MNKENRLVSIIVRTKDRPKLLRRALQSIAAQDYRPIEVVLVNDGETVLEATALKDDMQDIEVKYLDNSLQGRTVAANRGLKNAGGKFICFLDDDDILYNDHVSTLVYFLKDSDYKVAYTETYFVHTEYDPSGKANVQTQKYPAQTMDFSRDTLLFYNYIPFMCLMFESDALKYAGGFDNDFELCEDWDLTIRVSKKFPFYHIKKFTSEYTIWSRDLQSIQNNNKLFVYRKKIYQKHFEEFNADLVASFIFNGYWTNLEFMGNSINTLESEISKKHEYTHMLQEENQKLKDEKQRLIEKNQGLENENQKLNEENKKLWEGKQSIGNRLLQLEDYVRTNTIKFPKKVKKVLKSLLVR
jgi:glycosyltransferase involved in cell wall biosynthesis